jgi:cyclic lactone autoinducer peptide
MKYKALKCIAYGLSVVGLIATGASSLGCDFWFFDEPKMPNSLIEK